MITDMPRRSQPQPPRQPLGLPTNVRLPFEQRTALEVIAAARTVSTGHVIREALQRYLSEFVDERGQTILEAAAAGELDDFTVPDLGEDDDVGATESA